MWGAVTNMAPFLKSAIDPMTDPAAPEVIAMFRAAQADGLSTSDCYKRAVEAWRKIHPEQAIQYASCKAVEVVIQSRQHWLMWDDEP